MLIEFRVANYRSFAEEQVLSMEATSAQKLRERNLFLAPDGRRLLHTAAIYGANASGKSNLIQAMELMKTMVQYSVKDKPLLTSRRSFPFRLDPHLREQPSRFEITFFHEGVRYTYGFALRVEDQQRIVTGEWLYAYPHKRRQRWFLRQGQTWTYGPSFKGRKKSLEDMTRPDALFLSVGAMLNHPQLRTVAAWFEQQFEVIPTMLWSLGGFIQESAHKMKEDPRFGQWLETLLRYADIGIEHLDIREQSIEEYLSDNTVNAVLPEFGTAFKQVAQRLGTVTEPLYRIETIHRSADGQETSFSLVQEESQGTQLLFSAAVHLWRALTHGGTLVIDEIDTSLHPAILRLLVMLFQSPGITPPGAQLIFTTHDVSLLDPAIDPPLFRRDQIWFLEKDEKQASQLYSLADFREREDASFMRRYLIGLYGAIPNLQLWLDSLAHGLIPEEFAPLPDKAAVPHEA